VLEASPDLIHWSNVTTNPVAAGSLPYAFPATNRPGLFWRVKAQP
jgi:hypothetical protein